MELAINVLSYVNAAAAVLLAVVAALKAKHGGRPGRWGAAAFAALAVVLLVAALGDEALTGWAQKALVCTLLAFPYLLLHFTASFGGVSQRVLHLAGGSTVAIVAATLALPALPEEGAARPPWAVAYVAVVVVFWTVLSLVTIVALWRGGTGQPTLTRRRVRLMGAAAGGMDVLILLAAVGVSAGEGELIVQALLLTTLVLFGVGFAPPAFVRLAWRQPEQIALRHATEDLVGATTVAEVTDTLLPHVAGIVGGSGAALWDEQRRVMASFGSMPVDNGHPDGEGDAPTLELVPLSPPFGALVVVTSPLTPFFGREEVGLLHALGALTDLSLARCLLGERERESQAALHLAKEQAERANLAKSDFLSRMSHELRTPLNVVLGFGQILQLKGSMDERDSEAVESILKAGRHLLELINEVLDLSRIESGRMAISPEPVELAELVREALDLIRPLAQERSIRLIATLDACHRHVTADRQRLKQVLLNLLSNAVKYNRDGGEVAISCTEGETGGLRLRVSDTGPGIPTALMDRLFVPFERLGADRGHVEGTGLGLALSKQLVELMGGEIGLDSVNGEGATFWIELAIAEPPDDDREEAAGAEAQRPARPAGTRRVLLVEDNLANLKLIQAMMAGRHHIELLPAMTGSMGLELAREHLPDLILLDQHLPDLTGTNVLSRLKADPATRAIPIVVVSADATPGQIRRMLELGAVDYLTKPLDVTHFLQVIDRLLDPDRRNDE